MAPDSFKGTFSAREVAAAIAARAARGGPRGRGAAGGRRRRGHDRRAAVDARRARSASVRVSDPLGRPIDAAFALIDGGRTGHRRDGAGERAGAGRRGRARRLGGVHARDRRADRGGRRGGRRARDRDRGRLGDHRRRRRGARGAGGGRRRRSRWTCSATCARRSRTRRACSGRRRARTRRWCASCRSDSTGWRSGFRRDPRGEPMTGCAGGLSGGLWAEHGARLHDGPGVRAGRARVRRAHARRGLRGHRRGPHRRADAAGQAGRRGGHPLPPGAACPATGSSARSSWTRSRSGSWTSRR